MQLEGVRAAEDTATSAVSHDKICFESKNLPSIIGKSNIIFSLTIRDFLNFPDIP